MTLSIVQIDRDITCDNKDAKFQEIFKALQKSSRNLQTLGTEGIIERLDDFGRRLQKSKHRNIEGVLFLSRWLRKNNLKKIN